MIRAACGILCLALGAASAAADTVYLRNGRQYEGTTTAKGDKVIIQTALGSFEVPASEVLYISRGPVSTSPASLPAAPPQGDRPPADRPITAEQASQPETVIFILMRTLAGTPPGTASYDLRQQIEKWRAFAHDRKRRVGGRWLSPADFARQRQAFEQGLKEADELLRKVRYSSGTVSAEERKRAQAPAMAKLQAAAQSWPDPLIRSFLSGVAEHLAGDATGAEALFRRCAEELPLVAAFHQGRAMALLDANQPLRALEAVLTALELRPDSRDLVQVLQDAMKQVPGGRIKDPLFLRAQELLSAYADSGASGLSSYGGTNWLMPGREWRARGLSLPSPAYDRLVVRQAVGVPVAKNVLLADAQALKDAEDVLVRIDGNTWVPGQTRRSTYGRAADPLMVVFVPSCEFSPLLLADANHRPTGDGAEARGLASYAEMQAPLRALAVKLKPPDANGVIAAAGSLAPGDAAAPVLADDGTLVGFLSAKTDVMAEGGGPDRFIPIAQAAALVRQAQSSSSFSYSSLARARPNTAPRPVQGQVFIVRGIFAEKLQ